MYVYCLCNWRRHAGAEEKEKILDKLTNSQIEVCMCSVNRLLALHMHTHIIVLGTI